MKLETKRLELLELAQDDFEAIHQMNQFPEVARYNTIGIPKNISETSTRLEQVLRDKNALSWSIRSIENHEFIGQIGMNLSATRYKKGEVYFSLHPKFWSKGLASEAAAAVLKFGFETLNLHRVEAGVAIENTQSIALLERLGMTREGLCRKILPLATGWMDNYMYAILEEDQRDY